MAWTERLKQKRRLVAVCSNIDIDLGYLKEFSELYRAAHPLLADFAESIAGVLIQVQGQVKTLETNL